MLATTYSALLKGLETIKITIEIALTPGLPALQIVGLPSQTVAESKERITAALAISGIKPKAQRTVVNLAPADIRKTSSAFELPITAGLLQLYGIIPPLAPKTILFGELSLTGELKPVTGALPLILGAKKLGFSTVLLPAANHLEANLVSGISCIPLENLEGFILHSQGKSIIEPVRSRSFTHLRSSENSLENDEIHTNTTLFEGIGNRCCWRSQHIFTWSTRHW
jgi:magnesium chelatase family protein